MRYATAVEINDWTTREFPLQDSLRMWLSEAEHVEEADDVALEMVSLALELYERRDLQGRPDIQFLVRHWWRMSYALPHRQNMAVFEAIKLGGMYPPILMFDQ